MAIRLLSSHLNSDILLQRAARFAQELPQSLGARSEGKAINLTFIIDEKLPDDKVNYCKENINKYAKQAYKKIFSGQDEIDLLLLDIRLIFSVLFWDGQQLSEVEVTYFMNDLLFLATVDS
jgi:hypothetical protein